MIVVSKLIRGDWKELAWFAEEDLDGLRDLLTEFAGEYHPHDSEVELDMEVVSNEKYSPEVVLSKKDCCEWDEVLRWPMRRFDELKELVDKTSELVEEVREHEHTM